MKARLTAVLLLACLLLPACADLGSPTYLPPPVRKPRQPALAPAEPATPPTKRTLSVGVGETVDLTLDSNPSTGFRWFLAQPPDNLVLVLETHFYQSDPDAAGRVGAPGREVFRFRGVSPGSTNLTLEYARPTEREKGLAPAQRHAIAVRVR
ncbi:MAG: protease inhibitor I42 family protein [Pseudomonadota bacterium]